jgi:hypothetical protein
MFVLQLGGLSADIRVRGQVNTSLLSATVLLVQYMFKKYLAVGTPVIHNPVFITTERKYAKLTDQ